MSKRTEAEARMIHAALDGALDLLDMCESFGATDWAFQPELAPVKLSVEEFEALGERDAQ